MHPLTMKFFISLHYCIVSDDNLQSLYLLFGDVFEDATELLDRGRFILYRTDEGYREMIKVFRREEQYNLFIDINYCSCLFFTNQVLEARLAITCKHVLAAKLAQITKTTKMMGVTDTQFHQLLNDLIPDLK